jgi:uncharacterized protein
MYTTKFLNTFDLDEHHVLLVNGLSGAVDILDTADSLFLQQPDRLAERADKADLLNQLLRRGYVFRQPDEEQVAFDRIRKVYERMMEAQSYKFTFVFNPTYMCNFACPYCFESTEMHTTKQVMTPAQVELCFTAMERIIEMRAKGRDVSGSKKGLELFGGEPFLPIARPAVERILALAREKGYSVEAISNGYSLDKSRDLIAEYKSVFDHFQITLDGPQEIHDRRRKLLGGGKTFARILSNIEMLMDLDIKVAVRMNIDRENIDAVPTVLQDFAAKGWLGNGKFYWDLAPVTDHPSSGQVPNLMPEHEIVERIVGMSGRFVGSPTNFRMFRVLKHVLGVFGIYRNPKEEPFPAAHYCEANVYQFYCFGPDGLIYACPESINHPELAVGRYDPEFAIDPVKLAPWGRTIFNSPQCSDCSVAMFCGGGCAFASVLSHGESRLPVCDDAPAVLRSYIATIKDQILAKYCAA